MHNRGGGNMNHRPNGPARGGAAASSSADVLESQNEQMITNLQSKISSLKNITIAIGDEVKEQNRALEQMQNGMGATDNLLASTLGKMKMFFMVRWGRG